MWSQAQTKIIQKRYIESIMNVFKTAYINYAENRFN